MPIDVASKDQIQRVRTLLVDLDWTASDAWILVSELTDKFPGTLEQDTPTFETMPIEEMAELIKELELMLADEGQAVQ